MIKWFLFPLIFLCDISSSSAQNAPLYVDGDAKFTTDLSAIIQKTVSANASLQAHSFTISFDVRSDSTVTNINIINGSDPSVDQQLIRALSKMRFVPAMQNGNRIKMNVMKNITINY